MGSNKENSKIINYMGEFTDHMLEEEFFQQDMKKSLRFINPLVLALGVLNTLFLIPDYFLIHNPNTFTLIAIGRMLFVIFVLGLFFRLKHMKDFKVVANWLTVYEIMCILLFLFVFFQYESPNYLIQAFGVMVIIIAVFMVPNRWINSIAVSLFVSLSFIIMSIYSIENIQVSEFSAGIVYIFIVIILCSITAYRNHYYKRLQYISSKELIRISTTDHLSGAYNRAKLDDNLEELVEYSKKNKVPFSLVFIDFDNFKSINDFYGHLTGDNVIVEFAQIIRMSIREPDIFTRWGGEEFILLLPNTNIVEAIELGERLRSKIEMHSFKEVGRVTCSFGVVQLADDDDIKSLLQRADQKLYFAKNKGKNLVMG